MHCFDPDLRFVIADQIFFFFFKCYGRVNIGRWGAVIIVVVGVSPSRGDCRLKYERLGFIGEEVVLLAGFGEETLFSFLFRFFHCFFFSCIYLWID